MRRDLYRNPDIGHMVKLILNIHRIFVTGLSHGEIPKIVKLRKCAF